MMNAVQRGDKMPIQQTLSQGGSLDAPLADVSPTLCDGTAML